MNSQTSSAYPAPNCQHWAIGDVTVQELFGPHKYERAILVTFATIEEFRAALKYCDPMWASPVSSAKELPNG